MRNEKLIINQTMKELAKNPYDNELIVKLYTLKSNRIFYEMCFLTGSRDLAAQITQDTISKAWESINTLHNFQFCCAWIMKIAKNIFYKLKREKKHLVNIDDLDRVATLFSECEINDNSKELLKTIYNMPPQDRQIINYLIQGEHYKIICDKMQLTQRQLNYRIKTIREELNRFKYD